MQIVNQRTLQNNVTLEQYEVYCHMDEISGCGKGGWTLVMKVDGNQVIFNPAAKCRKRTDTCKT